MPGNGEFPLKVKEMEGGGNKQNQGNDSLITEKSGDRSGPTKPEDGKGNDYCVFPDGQKVK